MADKKLLKERIASEQQCMKRITNDDLICKDCEFVFDDSIQLGNTSKCEKYKIKPNKVLLGGDCIEYKIKE